MQLWNKSAAWMCWSHIDPERCYARCSINISRCHHFFVKKKHTCALANCIHTVAQCMLHHIHGRQCSRIDNRKRPGNPSVETKFIRVSVQFFFSFRRFFFLKMLVALKIQSCMTYEYCLSSLSQHIFFNGFGQVCDLRSAEISENYQRILTITKYIIYSLEGSPCLRGRRRVQVADTTRCMLGFDSVTLRISTWRPSAVCDAAATKAWCRFPGALKILGIDQCDGVDHKTWRQSIRLDAVNGFALTLDHTQRGSSGLDIRLKVQRIRKKFFRMQEGCALQHHRARWSVWCCVLYVAGICTISTMESMAKFSHLEKKKPDKHHTREGIFLGKAIVAGLETSANMGFIKNCRNPSNFIHFDRIPFMWKVYIGTLFAKCSFAAPYNVKRHVWRKTHTQYDPVRNLLITCTLKINHDWALAACAHIHTDPSLYSHGPYVFLYYGNLPHARTHCERGIASWLSRPSWRHSGPKPGSCIIKIRS